MTRARLQRIAQTIARKCPGISARQASRALARIYDEALRPLGLQSSQLSVLVAVVMHGEQGASIGQLADALVMERTTVTRNLRPLERAGLLHIARSGRDARARVVLLTSAGERILNRAYPLWESATRRITDSVGRQQIAHLHSRLASLVTKAEAARLGRRGKSLRAPNKR